MVALATVLNRVECGTNRLFKPIPKVAVTCLPILAQLALSEGPTKLRLVSVRDGCLNSAQLFGSSHDNTLREIVSGR